MALITLADLRLSPLMRQTIRSAQWLDEGTGWYIPVPQLRRTLWALRSREICRPTHRDRDCLTQFGEDVRKLILAEDAQ